MEHECESTGGRVARILHASSARACRPFAVVNVAALPAELLESELFGHGKGVFTGAAIAHPGLFEAADGGTRRGIIRCSAMQPARQRQGSWIG